MPFFNYKFNYFSLAAFASSICDSLQKEFVYSINLEIVEANSEIGIFT